MLIEKNRMFFPDRRILSNENNGETSYLKFTVMKRIFLILTAAAFFLVSCHNNPGVSKAFSKYGHERGVTSITVPGWVIGIAAKFGDLDKNERELLNSIDKVKVLSVEDNGLNSHINLHHEFYSKINVKHDFEELLTVNNQNENVTIFGKMEGDVIREMVILVGGNDNALVYLKGEIKPELLDNKINMSNPDRLLSLDF